MIIVEIPEKGAAFAADFFGDAQRRDFKCGQCRLHTVPGSAAIEAELVRIVIDLASNVGAGVIAAALYDSLSKAGISSIRINGVETKTEKERIEPRITSSPDRAGSGASNSSEPDTVTARKA